MSIRRLALTGLLCVAFLAIAGPATAHTALESSRPADGATVDEAVRRIVLTFTEPVDLAGRGAQLLDASGTPVDAAVAVDGVVVTIRPDEPLTGGDHGVRWAVRSGDGHPVRGSLRFTVDAPTAGDTPGGEQVREAPAPEVAEPDPAPADGAGAQRSAGDRGDAVPAALANALAVEGTRPLEITETVLRAAFYAVALGAMGVATFLLGAWDGPRREVRMLCRLIVRLALATAIVVTAQVAVRSALTGGGWDAAVAALPQTLAPTYAAGVGLRIVGAALLIAGTPLVRRRLLAAHPIAGAAVDVGTGPFVEQPPPEQHDTTGGRLGPGSIMLLGVGALAASFALVGHASTAEPRRVAMAAAVAHALAGAVWGGGLLALVTVLTQRRRRHPTSLGAGVLAARYSVLATGGVLVAGAAGVALAMVRLDTVPQLWTTAYGLALLAKVAVVGVVAAIGAYNHFVVVPTLRRSPDHVVGLRLRRLGLVEVGLLAVVVALTSVLVTLAG